MGNFFRSAEDIEALVCDSKDRDRIQTLVDERRRLQKLLAVLVDFQNRYPWASSVEEALKRIDRVLSHVDIRVAEDPAKNEERELLASRGLLRNGGLSTRWERLSNG